MKLRKLCYFEISFSQAFQSAQDAVQDPFVRGYFRYMFMQRLHKMTSKRKKKIKSNKNDSNNKDEEIFEIEFYKKVPVVRKII